MFIRTLTNLLIFSSLFFLCLLFDVRVGLHVFTLGFLLSSLFFLTTNQIFLLLLLFAFFHDVRFQFPMGFTFLIVFPFILLYPVILKLLRSRMLVLYGYLTLAAVITTFFQYRQQTTPQQILWTIVLSGGWVGVVYAYSITKYRQNLFLFKRKLRF